MTDDVVVRELEPDDLPAAWELGRLAFGGPADAPAGALLPSPGLTRYGAFDRAGRLVGKTTDLHHGQWWGGRLLAASDVGGVAVVPEARGAGVARAMLAHLLAGARARGAAVSALFPTVSAVYRANGWSAAGTLRTVDLPTASLPRHRPGTGLEVRAGTPDDVAAVHDLYTDVARVRSGLLSRDGPLFASDGLGDGVDGLTLVTEGVRLVGAASWSRGRGYGSGAVLEVEDLLATSAAAARALVGVLAGWRTVTPTLRCRPLSFDAAGAELPLELAREHHVAPWMHRPVDVVAAVATRGWAEGVRGRTTFTLRDDVAPWNTGTWSLTVEDGHGRLEPVTGSPGSVSGWRGSACSTPVRPRRACCDRPGCSTPASTTTSPGSRRSPPAPPPSCSTTSDSLPPSF